MNHVIRRAISIGTTLFVALAMGAATADSIRVRDGNIELVNAQGTATQINGNGEVVEAARSPDGKLIAYVVITPDLFIDTGAGRIRADEIWVMNAQGTEARRLVEGREDDKVELTLAGFSELHFSPKGDTIFFMSNAWATSNAIHAVELKTGHERFVCDGNSLEVITRGRYKGNLLVRKHKYRLQGGSYNWVWMVSPWGRDIKVASRAQ
jgi:hypothetical protein